ncbi:MAG TPA: S41 family peptidase [Candidatus Saccharimonadales bacterium]|nr:S41 family peptidase [Candidatus Saccharimonadales bacterium]
MHYPTNYDRRAKRKRIALWAAKIVGIAAAVVVIFVGGVGVGNGQISLQRSNASNKSLPADLDYTSVEQLYDTLKANYDGKLDTAKLLNGLKLGLAEATGDPYTTYLTAEQALEFKRQLVGTFSGIGAELGQDAAGNLLIVAPIDGAPASRAGLRPQDILATIDGKPTTGMSIEEAVSKIRGPKDTQVKLGIIRDKKEQLKFTITREDIKLTSVKSSVLDGNIGYIQITQFNEDTAQLVTAAAQDFKAKAVKGVILDLRGNPGGLLDQAVRVSSLWLSEGKVVLQERRGSISVATELANGRSTLQGTPTAILINEGSASASEIVAGALKDHNAATLFGAKSFGKGSVQQIQNLAHDSQVKVTIARWYRPNGQNIDKKGISPDQEIKMTDDDYKNKRDPQKDAALRFLRKK